MKLKPLRSSNYNEAVGFFKKHLDQVLKKAQGTDKREEQTSGPNN